MYFRKDRHVGKPVRRLLCVPATGNLSGDKYGEKGQTWDVQRAAGQVVVTDWRKKQTG